MPSSDVSPSVNALLKARQWQQALALVLSSTTQRPRAIAKVLHACARQQKWEHCLTLLNRIPVDQCRAIDVNVTLGSLSRVAAWQHSLHIYERFSVCTDTVSLNTTLHALSTEWPRALGVFENAAIRDAVSFNTMISARGLPWEIALTLLRSMDACPPTDGTYNAVHHALTRCGQWQRSLELLAEVEHPCRASVATCIRGMDSWEQAIRVLHQYERSTDTVNAALSVCARYGRWSEALSLLDSAEKPDAVSYNTALHAISNSRGRRGQARSLALALYRQMRRRRLALTTITYTSLITVMNSQSWQVALALFRRMPSPNTIASNAMLGALAKGNQWERALGLLRAMGRRTRSVKPDVVSFASAISATERSGEWEQALQLMGDMSSRRIAPNLVTYNSVLSALAQGNMLEQHEYPARRSADDIRRQSSVRASNREHVCAHVTRILAEMRRVGVDADVVTYNAALAAYGTNSRHVWSLWKAMKAETVPDALTYAVVIRAMDSERDARSTIIDEARRASLDWVHGKRDFGNLYDMVRLAGTLGDESLFFIKVRDLVFKQTIDSLKQGDWEALENFGLPNFGPFTREALDCLGLKAFDASVARNKVSRGVADVRARDVVVHVSCSAHGVDRIVRFGPSQSVLPSLYLNHDRSSHAERRALSQVLGHTGLVELYVTHRPCISCIAAMVDFQNRSPNATLRVAFDNDDCW